MKKKYLIAIISVIIFVWSIISFINYINDKKKDNKKNSYINECIDKLKRFNYSEEEEYDACACRHRYLFSKYGVKIYDKNFIIPTKQDSLQIIDCLLKARNIDKTIDSKTLLENI